MTHSIRSLAGGARLPAHTRASGRTPKGLFVVYTDEYVQTHADITTGTRRRHLAAGMAWPWLIAVALMVCFIWGNSMVPGEGSGNLSKGALAILQGALGNIGLPYGWLTEHIVRKAAHFTEYCVLALLAMQAFRPHRREHATGGRPSTFGDADLQGGLGAAGPSGDPGAANSSGAPGAGVGAHDAGWDRGRVLRAVACALLLVTVPSIDETIQRFSPGRGPAVADVLLDCCGAAAGVALTMLASNLARGRGMRGGSQQGRTDARTRMEKMER